MSGAGQMIRNMGQYLDKCKGQDNETMGTPRATLGGGQLVWLCDCLIKGIRPGALECWDSTRLVTLFLRTRRSSLYSIRCCAPFVRDKRLPTKNIFGSSISATRTLRHPKYLKPPVCLPDSGSSNGMAQRSRTSQF